MDDNATPTCAPLKWLRGDLHNHCERPELIEEYLSGLPDRLDFIALTNHAQKPVFFTQHEMIERARDLLPGFPIFFGLEWNAPEGRHACVVFPPGPREAERAYAFSRAHDHHVEGSNPDIGAAMSHLHALPADERPILFFNHPIPGDWSAAVIDRYQAENGTRIIAGIEAVHGHQAHANAAAMDPFVYPGGAVGGLADHVYQKGLPFALLAHSDFHIHKQPLQPDYPLGIFNYTLVGVEPGARDPASIFAALRRGCSCAAQGHWLDLFDYSIGQARPGDTWVGDSRGEAVLSIVFEARETLSNVDLIGRLSPDQAPALLHSFGLQQQGRIELKFKIPPHSSGYVRFRAVATSRARPVPGPPGPKLFLSSAILLDS